MFYLFIRQTVADYARWKEAFDTHLATRQAGGATAELFVWRDVDEPSEIVVVVGWRSLAQARLFTQSVSWQQALQHIGTIALPEVRLLEAVE
jgi:heme-degrading monooxygenase HmoA